ncbi:hypothetical protein H1R20_g10297, partial [Candolleomyces eurysporus]
MVLELTSSKFLDLPPELLLLVLGQLDEADLCALGCTCKDLNALVFPYFFDQYGPKGSLRGWISCYSPPKHGLRAIRCCLSIKNIKSIQYHFSQDIGTLVGEVKELHAIVKRLEVKDLELCLTDPGRWVADDFGRTASSLSVLTTSEWTKLYTGLLTTSLTRGCKRVELSGGHEFFRCLRKLERKPKASIGARSSREPAPRYFDESSSTAQRRSREIPDLAHVGRKLEAPNPKLEKLTLASDMLLSNTMFLDWTIQVFSWCAPTLTHLELQCCAISSETWHYFFSEINLPSLYHFRVANEEAMVQLSDILPFLSRHPSIRTLLLLDGIYLPPSPSSLLPKPILPSLEQVVAYPVYLQWLLRDKNQCPELKEITLLTGFWHGLSRPTSYRLVDKALETLLLPRSHKLDTIGLRLTQAYCGLDAWLQSHIDNFAAGVHNAQSSLFVTSKHILPRFVHTKHLRIDSMSYVDIIGSSDSQFSSRTQTGPSRLELVARFAGSFPNLEYLELLDTSTNADSFRPRVVDAIRQHCPQVKKLKFGRAAAIHIDQYGQSGSGNVVNVG